MKKQFLISLFIFLLPCFGIAQVVDSKQLGQITISPGGISNGKMTANCGQIVNLFAPGSTTTGINANKQPTSNLQLYPNPSIQIINVQNNDPNLASFSVRVFDINGNLVLVSLNTSEKITRLNTSALSAGTYIAEIYNSNNSVVKNFKFNKL